MKKDVKWIRSFDIQADPGRICTQRYQLTMSMTYCRGHCTSAHWPAPTHTEVWTTRCPKKRRRRVNFGLASLIIQLFRVADAQCILKMPSSCDEDKVSIAKKFVW